MKALLQRVTEAAVTVDGERIASIGPGLLVFVGVVSCGRHRVRPVQKREALMIATDMQLTLHLGVFLRPPPRV